MTRWAIMAAAPVVVWSAHFIAIYALISAACAERGLLDVTSARLIGAVVTAAAFVLCAVWATSALRRRRGQGHLSERGEAVAVLINASWWSALISGIAVIANAWPLIWYTGCTA